VAEEIRLDEETPEERAFDYARTVALSDGVFAIALTLLVLNIGIPTLASSHHSELGRRLLDHREEFSSYAISFAVISVFWVRHHLFFRGLTRIDTRLTVLNLVYLAFVAFVPYPTRLLGLYGDDPASVALYASSLAIIATLAGFSREHARRASLLSPTGVRELSDREHWLIVPAVFLASIPVSIASPTAAKLLWLLLLIPNARHKVQVPRPGRTPR
jgi:TMEM175 potassium channel family protein